MDVGTKQKNPPKIVVIRGLKNFYFSIFSSGYIFATFLLSKNDEKIIQTCLLSENYTNFLSDALI